MNKNKILIFLVLSILGYVKAAQDLCGAALAQGTAFANDPGDCTRYIYCERNSTNHLTRVGYGQCDQGSPFKYFKGGACTTDPSLCAPGALCPASGDYKVAVPSDSCTSYRFCKLTGMPPTNCAEGLTFERSSGTCVDNSDGFVGTCPIPPPPGAPTTTTTTLPAGVCIDVPDYTFMQYGDCQKWAFCVGNAVYDQGTCPCGYGSKDDSDTDCVVDESCNPCSTTAGPTEAPTEAPTDAPVETPTEAPTEPPTDPPTDAPNFCAGKTVGFYQNGACDEWTQCDGSDGITDQGTCDCGDEFDGAAASAPPCKNSQDTTVSCTDGTTSCTPVFSIKRKVKSFLFL